MTSELRVDNLKGSTTGGSINVLGEGTSATTNLQQGLCKAWVDYDLNGTASLDDSFNFSSITDNGTGDATLTFSNSFSNANFAIATAYHNQSANKADLKLYDNTTTGRLASFARLRKFEDGSLTDSDINFATFFGDLA